MPADRDSRRYQLLVRLVGWLGALFLRTLGGTWRVTTEGPDPFLGKEHFVGAMWHQGVLVAAYYWRDLGAAVPVSRSRDGDLIDAVLRGLGFAASPRGSSSKGGTSTLRTMIRLVRGGTVIGVLTDGPRGPARRVKRGVVALASASGAALIPVGLAARPAHRFASWDRALLPLPFARVHCVYGEPIHVPKEMKNPEAIERELEITLDRVTEAAERALTHRPVATAGEPPA